jgi:hypothetical protein
MAKLLITTQVYENYGAHDWDGEGACPQYWKAKGGNDYVIKKFRGGDEEATKAIFCLRNQIESNNDAFQETIIGWNIVSDKYLTEFEQSQLDYEGKITYSPKELAW